MGSPCCKIGNKLITISDQSNKYVEMMPIVDQINNNISVQRAEEPFPDPKDTIKWHTITNIRDGVVIVTGGVSWGRIKAKVYEGTLSNDENNVVWKQLSSISKPLIGHVAFKLHDCLYVVGGFTVPGEWSKTSEIYNLNTQNWTPGPELPVSLSTLTAATDTM